MKKKEEKKKSYLNFVVSEAKKIKKNSKSMLIDKKTEKIKKGKEKTYT